jgi:hypothetical protein
MTSHQRWTAVRNAGLLLLLGLLAVAETGRAADAKAVVVPDTDYAKLVKRLTKGIQDSLKGGKPSAEAKEKAHTAAVLIAAAAQLRLDGTDGQQRATVRDAALKVADTIKAGKYDEALKLAEALPSLKEDAKSKKEKVPLVEAYVTFPKLMHQFRTPKEGGWGIYSHLYQLQTKMQPVLPRGEVNDTFILEADQIALSADLALSNVPKSKPKEFTTNLENLRQGAIDLAAALKDKEAAKVAVEPLSKLTTTCFGCHKTFRDK